MIRSKCGIRGAVGAVVFEGRPGKIELLNKTWAQKLFNRPATIKVSPFAKVKRYPKKWWQVLFGFEGSLMMVSTNNIVTDQGDALICDALSTTPARTLPNNANAAIGVGTGFVSAIKGRTALAAITGAYEAMDATYPLQKGAWGAADDNVLQFLASFEVADLNASGIDEVALSNGTDNLAYAEINPAINVTSSDSLAVTWELTFLGA